MPGVSVIGGNVADKPSKISTDIDFERDGKQAGTLGAPHSTNASGWGTLLIPLVCIKNGDGSTILFTGGNHGDEYEGPIALLKLARELTADQVRGRVLIMPGLNYPALTAGTRLSPIDGGNMNRAFPGNRDGSITPMIADYVYRTLLPMADVVVDLHSGGASMIFEPSVVMHHLPDAVQMRQTLAAVRDFGAPLALILRELDSGGMLDGAVENMGKIFISTELGGGAFVTPQSLRVADLGVRNMLRHFGFIEGKPQTPSELGLPETRLMEVPETGGYMMAWVSGLYEPLVEVGEPVREGQSVGRIHAMDFPDRDATAVNAARDGRLITRAGRGQVRRGDTVGVIAVDYDATDV